MERHLSWKMTKLNFPLSGAPHAGEPARLLLKMVCGSRRKVAGIFILPSEHASWDGETVTSHILSLLAPCLATTQYQDLQAHC